MLITIFTPTYNRDFFLERLYDSLCQQSSLNFEWLIVDDGSTDNTEVVFQRIISSHTLDFPIKYFKKKNGGKHTAINEGVRRAAGELFLILDSDDSLPVDAVEKIIFFYNQCKMKKDCGGVCGVMAHHSGERIGSGMPAYTIYTDTITLRNQYKVTGDLLEVFKTSVLREFPFPEIIGEKFCPEILIWNRIACSYKLLCFNQIVYYRDYLEGGLTDKIVKIRMQNPVATMMTYAEMLTYSISFKAKVRSAINYWRFRMCLTAMTEDYPKISKSWLWLKPLAWLMYRKDLIEMI